MEETGKKTKRDGAGERGAETQWEDAHAEMDREKYMGQVTGSKDAARTSLPL